MFQYHQCSTDNRLFGSRPGGRIHSNVHFSLWSECKNNDPQASSIPCSIYIILVRHYTGDTLFTPCNMMHPTIKNCCLNNYNSRVRTCVCALQLPTISLIKPLIKLKYCANLLEAISVRVYQEVVI